jgi:hypothetical protein
MHAYFATQILQTPLFAKHANLIRIRIITSRTLGTHPWGRISKTMVVRRFSIGFTAAEKADLFAFLRSF